MGTVPKETVLITVRLFAGLRVGRFAAISWRVPPNTSIAAVLEELAIPESRVGILVLNQRRVTPQENVRDGDAISVFPVDHEE